MSPPIVIIGAGIGGLSAAIRLAASGEQVAIYEQGGQVGGKMSEVRADGFRWDTGPSVITMRYVFDDLFRAAGRKLEDYLALVPAEPLTRYFYQDGAVFNPSLDLATTLQQIEVIDPRDLDGYRAYLAYAERIHRITGDKFIYGEPPTLRKLLLTPPRDMLAVDPLRTMDGAIRSFVQSPKIRQFLGRFATYVGASPFLAPATLNVIAHVELSGGVWYPQGGIYTIARALERLALELGVEIHLNSTVQSIDVQSGQAVGIVLQEGTRSAAKAVIANVDVATVYEKLLPESPSQKARLEALTKVELSCSGFILLLGIEGQESRLAHHNILFSTDYRREFDDIFRRGIPPDEPTVYIAITSKNDVAHAPPGCENWFVLVNAPPLGEFFNWTTQATQYREVVLKQIEAFGFEVRGRIRTEQMLTPLDLERQTGARRGALYGTGANDRFSAFRRPHNRDRYVRGLYFAGGTAHPGGGVPMVMLSARAATSMLLRDIKGTSHD